MVLSHQERNVGRCGLGSPVTPLTCAVRRHLTDGAYRACGYYTIKRSNRKPPVRVGKVKERQSLRETQMKKCVEVRSYNLKAGRRNEFHRLVVEESVPLLERWGIDVVAYGPSPHDETSYFLIRAYRDLAERSASQEAFYGSQDWREGPREAIVTLIESDTSIVLQMETSVIDALRQGHERHIE